MSKETLDEKLERYRTTKIEFAELKAKEMDLRVEIAAELAGEDGLAAGTHNFHEFPNMKVKLVNKLNYKVDKDTLETLNLSEEEAECIKWKPELALRAYKALEESENLDEAIFVSDGAPELVVELT